MEFRVAAPRLSRLTIRELQGTIIMSEHKESAPILAEMNMGRAGGRNVRS